MIIKKNIVLSVAMIGVALIAVFCLAVSQANAQKEYTKVMIWAEDAVGNKDTVWFVGQEGAFDTELGEVNLYGVPPQGDLDLRIIQRTATIRCKWKNLCIHLQ